MKRSWIKLYVEILDDAKIGPLPIWLKWRFVELLLVAAESDEEGLLRPVPFLAWRLRIMEDDLINSLRALSEVGVVIQVGDRWKVTNFEKRQAALTGAERVAQYRKRSNEPVTRDETKSYRSRVTSSTSTSKSSSVSSEEGEGVGEGETAPDIFTVYEANIGPITPLIADALKDAEKDFPPSWIRDSLRLAVENNKRNWNYCLAILKRWQVEGKDDGRKNNRTNGKAEKLPQGAEAALKWLSKKKAEVPHG